MKKQESYKRSKILFDELKNHRSTTKKIVSRGNRLFRIFNNMKQRCYNENHPQYHNYGGKNIFICSEWLMDSNNFYRWALDNGYEDNLTIERVDNNAEYSPKNCIWTDRSNQARNRDTNVNVTIGFETKCLKDWCVFYDISYSTVRNRINYGWDVIKAITTPARVKIK